jgi:hypothetical protein
MMQWIDSDVKVAVQAGNNQNYDLKALLRGYLLTVKTNEKIHSHPWIAPAKKFRRDVHLQLTVTLKLRHVSKTGPSC